MNISNLESTQRNIPYTYREGDSDTLCIMLSGTGYTYEKPLLYYAAMQVLEAQYDLVQIHYSYEASHFKLAMQEFVSIIVDDIESVITDVVRHKNYEQIIFIGKSLGTLPIAYHYSKCEHFKDAKLLLLTPVFQLEGFNEAIQKCGKEMLVVIGTEDKHYIKGHIEELRKKENVRVVEIAGANHSLEVEPADTKGSLRVLAGVMDEVGRFL